MREVVLLPGALGASEDFRELTQLLKPEFNIHLYDFPGHAGRPMPESGLSIQVISDDLAEWLKSKNLTNVCFFGYSMGGYVALYLAHKYPELVERVATLGTKLAWTEDIAAAELRKLEPEVIESKVPQFAKALSDKHHTTGWKAVVQQTAQLMQLLGAQPLLTGRVLSTLQQPILLGIGDSDGMVTIEETLQAKRHLQLGQLSILPATLHPWNKVPLTLMAAVLNRFFN